jgi:hypothetical protein
MCVNIYSNLVKSWTDKNEIYLNSYSHEMMKWTEKRNVKIARGNIIYIDFSIA